MAGTKELPQVISNCAQHYWIERTVWLYFYYKHGQFCTLFCLVRLWIRYYLSIKLHGGSALSLVMVPEKQGIDFWYRSGWIRHGRCYLRSYLDRVGQP
jgi:hypothetical protein